VNQTSSDLFYTYQTNGTQYELTAKMESQKYQSVAANDGGPYADLVEEGTNLTLAAMDFGNASSTGGIATGTVTLANMKMSIVNGDAFVDFGASGSLTPYIGDKLTITDSGSHTLVGYIKAAGTGETYGSELLYDPGMDNASYFSAGGTPATLAIATSGCQSGSCLQVTPTTAWGWAYQNFTATSGMLLKASAYMKQGTETSGEWLYILDPTWRVTLARVSAWPSSWTQYAGYGTTATTSANYLQAYEGATVGKTSLFDTASVKQVLTPSATGVTITSTMGGSTYNWTSEDSGFNVDDSGGYTYSISH
jgi:hypothetical protein